MILSNNTIVKKRLFGNNQNGDLSRKWSMLLDGRLNLTSRKRFQKGTNICSL